MCLYFILSVSKKKEENKTETVEHIAQLHYIKVEGKGLCRNFIYDGIFIVICVHTSYNVPSLDRNYSPHEDTP